MKKLGVIGGLGPIATSYFYELLTKLTKAETDQEHLEVMIFSCPSIPDRTAYILDKSKENPIIPMLEVGNTLVGLGADYIAIPCITAHYFYDELSKNIKAPIIHIIKETVLDLKERGAKCAGLMATDGTISSAVFQNELESNGIDVIIPSAKGQAYVMDLVYRDVKANKPVEIEKFRYVSDELTAKGADTIVLACTELSLIKRDYELASGYVDALEILALRSLSLCGAAVHRL